jgi:hypothetical protein
MSSIAKPTPQSKGLPRKQRRVKFNECGVRNREALHIHDYTEEEIQATWYSCDETLAFKKKACIQTAMLQQLLGRNIPEKRRVDAWKAILGEQQRQIDEEDYKPKIIANLCREITDISLKEARSSGVSDEKQVQQDRDLERAEGFRRSLEKEAPRNISLAAGGGLTRLPHQPEDLEAVRPSAVAA